MGLLRRVKNKIFVEPRLQAQFGEVLQGLRAMYLGWEEDPDDIIKTTGKYDVYYDMDNDAVVSSALDYLTDRVVTESYNVTCEDKNGHDDPVMVKYLEYALRVKFERGFLAWAKETLRLAAKCGWVLEEKVWAKDSDGTWLVNAKPKLHENVRLDVDAFGNIKRILWRNPNTRQFTPVPDMYKFIYFAPCSRLGSPYGRSMLRAAYRPYKIRQSIIKSFGVYVTRLGFPALIALYDPSGSDAERERKLLKMLADLVNAQRAAFPKTVDVIDVPIATADPGHFVEANELMMREIWHAILGAYLMVGEGRGSTSRSAAEVHESTAERHIVQLRHQLEDCIACDLLYWIALYKFGPERVERYQPRIEFMQRVTSDKLATAQTWMLLGKMGIKIDLDYMEQVMGIPRGMLTRRESLDSPRGELKASSSEQTTVEKDTNVRDVTHQDMKYNPERKQQRSDEATGR